MSVNDVITVGARPLFFLDYFATASSTSAWARPSSAASRRAASAPAARSLGGETAELPGMYAPGEYDLAGFVVGVVERARSSTASGRARATR